MLSQHSPIYIRVKTDRQIVAQDRLEKPRQIDIFPSSLRCGKDPPVSWRAESWVQRSKAGNPKCGQRSEIVLRPIEEIRACRESRLGEGGRNADFTQDRILLISNRAEELGSSAFNRAEEFMVSHTLIITADNDPIRAERFIS